jgi:hypothetical protein
LEPKKSTINFDRVLKKLKNEGSAQGFRALRDYLLENYAAFKGEFTPAGLMNLIISADKHAIFADMSSEKSKEHEYLRWKLFQDYVNGKIEKYSLPDESSEEETEDDELPVQEGEQEG